MSPRPPARREPPTPAVIDLAERLDRVLEDYRVSHPDATGETVRRALRIVEERAVPAKRESPWTRPAFVLALGAGLSIVGRVLGLTDWAGFVVGVGGAALMAVGVALLVGRLIDRD